MDCIHLVLSNRTIDIDPKHDDVVFKSRKVMTVMDRETGKCSPPIKSTPGVIAEFRRRIEKARADVTVDCTDLHGEVLE